MIRNLNTQNTNPFVNEAFDICICGAGFAGISLALKLPRHLKILLLEGGGFEYQNVSQDIYKGEITGRDYFPLTTTRLRQFGGTSGLWSGWCRALDPVDFTVRDYAPNTGWPIQYSDLSPYFAETRDILHAVLPAEKWYGALPPLAGLKAFDFQWSFPATNMGTKYRQEIENRENIHCYINANLTNITLNKDHTSVSHIEVRNYQGLLCHAQPGKLILALGGIENARLLLNCNQQINAGLGNQNDLVGRFFTEHPHYEIGHFILEDAYSHHLAKIKQDHAPAMTEYLSPTEDFMQTNKCLNFGLRVTHSAGKRDLPFSNKLDRALCRTDWWQELPPEMRLPPLDCTNDGYIHIASEQTPNPESRITLGTDIDKFGLKRPNLNWRLSKLDKHTMLQAVTQLGITFAQQNLGRVRIVDWLLDSKAPIPGFPGEIGGHHHMCTTRMSHTAKTGVVDKNQKVFGIDNLYMAGTSVFSSGGHANPTFTVVQLSLRLADHLGSLYKA